MLKMLALAAAALVALAAAPDTAAAANRPQCTCVRAAPHHRTHRVRRVHHRLHHRAVRRRRHRLHTAMSCPPRYAAAVGRPARAVIQAQAQPPATPRVPPQVLSTQLMWQTAPAAPQRLTPGHRWGELNP